MARNDPVVSLNELFGDELSTGRNDPVVSFDELMAPEPASELQAIGAGIGAGLASPLLRAGAALTSEELTKPRYTLAKSTLAGPVAGGIMQAGGALAGTGVSEYLDTSADEINRWSQAITEGASLDDPEGWRGHIVRGLRSAAISIPPMVVGGALAGPAGAIGMAAGQTANRAITEGRDAGLEGGKLAAYVSAQGVIEGAVAGIFQKIPGFGGAESVFGKRMAKMSMAQFFKSLGTNVTGELTEENITEFGQNVVNKLSGVDPKALSKENMWNTFWDTNVAVGASLGLFSSPAAARQIRDSMPERPVDAEILPEAEDAEILDDVAEGTATPTPPIINPNAEDPDGLIDKFLEQKFDEDGNLIPPSRTPTDELKKRGFIRMEEPTSSTEQREALRQRILQERGIEPPVAEPPTEPVTPVTEPVTPTEPVTSEPAEPIAEPPTEPVTPVTEPVTPPVTPSDPTSLPQQYIDAATQTANKNPPVSYTENEDGTVTFTYQDGVVGEPKTAEELAGLVETITGKPPVEPVTEPTDEPVTPVTPPVTEPVTPTPEPSARYIAQVEGLVQPGIYDRDAGVKEGLTIREHTEHVQRNWDVESEGLPDEVAAEAGFTDTNRLNDFMGVMIALHDIGKPLAVDAKRKGDQHKYTIPILQETMQGMGFSEFEVNLATTLVNNDNIGRFIQGKIDLVGAVRGIDNAAKEAGVSPQTFMYLQSAFYKSDAGAYPTIREKLAAGAASKDKPLRIKDVRFLQLQESVYGKPLDYSWIGQSGEAGKGSRGPRFTGRSGRGFDFIHGADRKFPGFDAELDSGRNNHGPGAYLLTVEDEDIAEHYSNRAMRRLLSIFESMKTRSFIMAATKEDLNILIQRAHEEREKFAERGKQKTVEKYNEAIEVLGNVRDGLYGRHVLPVDFSPKKVLALGAMDTGGLISPPKRKALLALVPEANADKAPRRVEELYQHLGQMIGRAELNNRLVDAGYDALTFVHSEGGFTRPYEVMVALRHTDPTVVEPVTETVAPPAAEPEAPAVVEEESTVTEPVKAPKRRFKKPAKEKPKEEVEESVAPEPPQTRRRSWKRKPPAPKPVEPDTEPIPDPVVPAAKAPPPEPPQKLDTERIVDKLIKWQEGERLTDPEGFRASWVEWEDDKRKAVLNELVNRGQLPIGMERRETVNASDVLTELGRKLKSSRYKKPKAPKKGIKKKAPPKKSVKKKAPGKVKLTKEGKLDLSGIEEPALIHLAKTAKDYSKYGPLGEIREAADTELQSRGSPGYTQGPKEAEPLFEKYNNLRRLAEELGDNIPAAEGMLAQVLRRTTLNEARKLGIPNGRGDYGLSAAKKWKNKVVGAKIAAKNHPDVKAAEEAIVEAERKADAAKEESKKAELAYTKEAGKGFREVPIGEKRHSIEGRSTVTVLKFDPERGQYQVETAGGYEMWVSPQPLIDNYQNKEEMERTAEIEEEIRTLQKEKADKEAKAKAKEKEKEDVERAKRQRVAKKEQAKEKRFWRGLAERAGDIKTTKKTHKFKDQEVTGHIEGTETGAAIDVGVFGKWGVFKTLVEGKKGKKKQAWQLVYMPDEAMIETGSSGKVLKELAQMIDESGLSYAKGLKGNKKEQGLLNQVYRAWSEESLAKVTDEALAKKFPLPETPPSGVVADIEVDSADITLGTRGKTDKTSIETIQGLAKEVPEFAYNPVLTVDADNMLVFKDRYKYRLAPEVLGLLPGELTEGQTVGVNLPDLGISKPAPAEVVKSVLETEFKVSKGITQGTLSLTSLTAGPTKGDKVTVRGDGENWSVTKGVETVAGKRAQTLLDGIPWSKKEQVAKNEEAVEAAAPGEEFSRPSRVPKPAKDRGEPSVAPSKPSDRGEDPREDAEATGVFSRAPDEVAKRRNKIHSVPMPELVKFVKDVIGKYPTLAKLRSAAGKAKMAVGWKGSDKLHPVLDILIDYKTTRDAYALAQTLAHEMGHITDFLDDMTLKRGNILGRLASLKSFTKSTMPSLDKSLVVDAEIRDELLNLTRWWSGDWEGAEKWYQDYRKSTWELYAEALSVFIVSPGTLQSRAPTFYKEFVERLNAKPEIMREYLTLQAVLDGTPEEIARARTERMIAGFDSGDERTNADEQARLARKTNYIEAIQQYLLDVRAPIMRRAKSVLKRVADHPLAKAAKYTLDELNYKENDNHRMLQKFQQNVWEPAKKEEITREDFGEYMVMRRIVKGGRRKKGILIGKTGEPEVVQWEIANPQGFTEKDAADQIAAIKQRMGDAKYAKMESLMRKFDDIIFGIMERAVESGVISQKQFDEDIVPHRDNYGTFAVVKHLDGYIPAQIKEQVGTFEDIGNPLDFTLMKMMSMNRLIALNRAQHASVDLLHAEFSDEIERQAIPLGKGNKPDPRLLRPRLKEGYITHLVDGKYVADKVDVVISNSFLTHDIGSLTWLEKSLHNPIYKVIHPLYISLNPGFLAANPFRDFWRTYRNMAALGSGMAKKAKRAGDANWRDKKITFADVVREYRKALPAAQRHANTNMDDATVNKMLENKALTFAWTEMGAEEIETAEGQFQPMLKKYGLGKKEPPPGVVRKSWEKLIGIADYVGTFQETSSKVAAWQLLKDRGVEDADAAYYVRKLSGTPDYKQRGLWTGFTNTALLFSKVRWNGLTSDASLYTDPDTRSGAMWRQLLLNVLPVMAQKAAMYGLLGAGLKAFYGKIPEYFVNAYDILPIGWFWDDDDEEHKAMFITVPLDDTSRMIRNVVSKGIDAAAGMGGFQTRDKSAMESMNELFEGLRTDTIGTVSPTFAIPFKWSEFAAGRNPYDAFTNKPIIPNTHFEAGGWYSSSKMISWTFDQTGAARIILENPLFLHALGEPFDPTDVSYLEAGAKWAGKATGAGRLIRYNNRGISEQEYARIDYEEQEGARMRLSLPASARANTLERWKLMYKRRNGELKGNEAGELGALSYWYGEVYLPLTKAIKYLEANSRGDEADEFRERLGKSAKALQKSIRESR